MFSQENYHNVASHEFCIAIVTYLEDVFCYTSFSRPQLERVLDAKQLPLVVTVSSDGMEVPASIFASCCNVSKLLQAVFFLRIYFHIYSLYTYIHTYINIHNYQI